MSEPSITEKLDMELKDLSLPAMVAGGAVALSFALRKLTGYSPGINTNSFGKALAAFVTVTALGSGVRWYDKQKK